MHRPDKCKMGDRSTLFCPRRILAPLRRRMGEETCIVVGADAGSKLDKAKALGITTIDEAELLRRLGR